MSHRKFQSLLEEYADKSLPDTKSSRELEEHLRWCAECRNQLSLIEWTRGIIRMARPEQGPMPEPGFSRNVINEVIKQDYLWRPLRLIAIRAIPVMALLAVILGVLAYQQASSLFTQQAPDSVLVDTYADLPTTWGQDRTIISDTVFQDRDRVVDILMEGRLGGTSERNGKK
ncbi:MAG TPA: zf-HC2 domain-containing protein [Terriglobia bacterium]|nr:zf-HC2 domain-containing protein [Terriglobia bacterium]